MMNGDVALARLVDEVLPFWIDRGVDSTHGGLMTCLDRDGSVLDDDKGVWQQFRFAWLLARAMRTIEPRPAWRTALDAVFDFGRRHAADEDGRMFFHLDRAGCPIRKRRYAYSECFAAMAMAEVAALDRDAALARDAEAMFRLARRVMTEPGMMTAKTMNRPAKPFGHPMISLGVSQVFRDSVGGAFADEVAIATVDEIRTDFLKPERQAVMEVVAPDGSVIDHLESRQLNPGHAMEGSWFMLEEGRRREDSDMVDAGIDMLDWSWDRGWDRKHGGILAFVDLAGGPPAAIEHEMKYWWPHCEAILACRMAHQATGDPRYRDREYAATTWALDHFDDPDHPEWFGYLRRDGSIASRVKGNLWKGPFHLPRMLLTIAMSEGAVERPVVVPGLLDG